LSEQLSSWRAGPPEITSVAATIQGKATKFAAARCAGENGIPYITYRGAWAGGESGTATPYNLTGNWSVKGIVWTINLKTQRGVLHGVASLVSTSATGANVLTYSGPMTLITQGLPTTAGAEVQARGWIDAPTYTGNKVDGGSLLANAEFQIGGGFSPNGEFGTSMGFQDLSVVTNNNVCP
jgi:hypothetical protein